LATPALGSARTAEASPWEEANRRGSQRGRGENPEGEGSPGEHRAAAGSERGSFRGYESTLRRQGPEAEPNRDGERQEGRADPRGARLELGKKL
jgi:hypothetical protein